MMTWKHREFYQAASGAGLHYVTDGSAAISRRQLHAAVVRLVEESRVR